MMHQAVRKKNNSDPTSDSKINLVDSDRRYWSLIPLGAAAAAAAVGIAAMSIAADVYQMRRCG